MAHFKYRQFPDRNRESVPKLGTTVFLMSRYYGDYSNFINLPLVWTFQTFDPRLRKARYRCSVAIQHKNVTGPVTFQADWIPGSEASQ